MRYFTKFNPAVLFGYYTAVIATAMFSMNPVIISISAFGAYLFFITSGFRAKAADHLIHALILICGTLINPIFSHNGRTVLFVVNDKPITLESLIYGFFASLMILAVFIWFRTFFKIMTSDKLLYLFGALSPKLELILSVALRYIPLFAAQAEKISHTQKAMGVSSSDSITDEIKGGSRVFSVMVTWALENGIITAESMEARGYGIGRRTSFKLYRFRRSDIILAITSAVLFAAVITALVCGALDFDYYPDISGLSDSFISVNAYAAYALLTLIPVIIEKGETIRWKYYRSRI